MLIREDTRRLGLDAGSIASVVAVLGLGIAGVDGGSFFVHGVLLPALPVRDRGTRHRAHPRPLELPAYRQGSSSPARRDSCRGRPPVVARSRPRCGLLTSETPGRRTPALSAASTLWLPAGALADATPAGYIAVHHEQGRAPTTASTAMAAGYPGGPPSTRTAGASGAPPGRRGDRGRSSSEVSALRWTSVAATASRDKTLLTVRSRQGACTMQTLRPAASPTPEDPVVALSPLLEETADVGVTRLSASGGSGRAAVPLARIARRDCLEYLRCFDVPGRFLPRDPSASAHAVALAGRALLRQRAPRTRVVLLRRGPEPPRPRGGRRAGARRLTSCVVLQVSARLPVAGPTAVLP